MPRLFSGPPSGDPKRNTYVAVHQQTIGGIVEVHLFTSLLNCGAKLMCKRCYLRSPQLTRVDPVAIAFRSVTNKPVRISQRSEMIHIRCGGRKPNCFIDYSATK